VPSSSQNSGTSWRRWSGRPPKELLLFRLRGLQDGGGFAVSSAEHKAILKAIAAHDAERAGRLLRRHATDSRARMHKAAARAQDTAR